MAFAVGCTPPRSSYREIHVCARPPVMPRSVATWSISGSGTLLWEPRELAMGRAHDSPLYVYDPDAPADSVKLLPIPYNNLKCARRLSPPRPPAPKKIAAARAVEAKEAKKSTVTVKARPEPIRRAPESEEPHRTRTRVVVRQTRTGEAPATVSVVARREARCPNDPGQVRRTRSTGEACRGAEKSTSVRPRPAVRAARVVGGEGTDEPAPIEPPRPAGEQLQDWNVREPEVTGLPVERAKECLANLCHARHPNFVPKEKEGSGKAAGPREGQAWSKGGKAGAGGSEPPKPKSPGDGGVGPKPERALPSAGPTTRAEALARKLKLNADSPTTQQVLNSLDAKVGDFVAKYRRGSIQRELPWDEIKDMTLEKALQHSHKVRKLLTDGRFAK
ncbi:hypothetical protein [Polyangium sp. 6x1]|uniref:hypothetical protein n=1 Tax=Polyangium sp. 6x1 TaxID=3042689 RepID=UPI00248308A5|nr:hypothetical protein [Polyangium sp. 6x1]MDI1449325.1 hypothetical protein [Polyangium sp. 6x1]